jgi:hypothetical protein
MTSTMYATEHTAPMAAAGFLLVFHPLHGGKLFSFPCDAAGLVTIDGLSDGARANYLLARTLIGRDYQRPVVAPDLVQPATRTCGRASS